ncbi:MAG TPA: AraC family transcriptional regulator [Acidocella sp.]|uniref:helix-turn-helix domain-containing protein n=1 Tax=Acidocella sp. TaxID=50710 RepID=UPI002C612B87|nr:AraC family transcriptional regulator [Acidocella sp.]HVE22919.1 AraC family transcriptional regulator [Acidocella sp.]
MAHGFTASPWYDLSPACPEAGPSPDARPHAQAEPARPPSGRHDEDGQATATLIAAKLIALCRAAGAGDGGLASFLDNLLAAVTARLDRIDEHGTAASHRLATWQENAAKKLMTQDLSCPPSLQALASACGMSASGFARAFRGSTGMSPRQWLISVRIGRARDMLADSAVPLSAIALDCGFCDQSHFTRTFTQLVGKTPAIWRREARHRPGSAPVAWEDDQEWRSHLACAAE